VSTKKVINQHLDIAGMDEYQNITILSSLKANSFVQSN